MSFTKILTVASSEYQTSVRSRAFIISVVLMPVLMFVSIALQTFVAKRADTETRKVAVIDHTGRLFPMLEQAAATFNARGGPQFVLSRETPRSDNLDATRLALSDRVRSEDLFAFVEIPAAVLDPATTETIVYHSDHPSYDTLPTWLARVLNGEIRNQRFATSSVDVDLITTLSKEIDLDNLGLVESDGTGGVTAGKVVDRVASTGIPAAMMFLVYIVVMAGAPQLLNAVMEEKQSRISEVLLGSVTPTQLMLGKLMGAAGVSLTLALIYLAGAAALAQRFGYTSAITPMALVLFFVFMLLAVLIFGSIFIAIGAACNDMKDAQGMMTPAMLLIMFPIFCWMVVLRAPDSPLSTVLSLIPFATPFLMMLRASLQPGPPIWQLALSVALTLATTLVLVWAAGKIFRTGILMQGKSASFGEMLRWVRRG